MSSPSTATQRSAPLQVSEEKYAAGLVRDGQRMRVQFRGTISTVDPAKVLNPFVDGVHEHVVRAGAKDVYVDFLDLEFCNSSGFKSFIYWIQKIQELPEGQRYKLRFMSNPARKWQRTSLLALSCYAVNAIEIT